MGVAARAVLGDSTPGGAPTFFLNVCLLLVVVAFAILGLGWGKGEERGPMASVPLQHDTVQRRVAASAGIHGFLHKEGMTDLHNWHPRHGPYRAERLKRWMAERKEMLEQGKLAPPLPQHPACQVFVNHLYRVVYLRFAKAASTSLLCHFGGCSANATDPSQKGLGFKLLQEDIKLEPLDPEHVADLAGMWRSYFVAAFVRNPFQRAVSAYHMLARNLDPAGPAAQAYDWNTFCADPAGFLDLCKQDAKCNSTKDAQHIFGHIHPMHDCLITEGGGWAVDFIGRVEHIDADLQAMLEEIERRRPAEAPPVKPLQGSLGNVNGRSCEGATGGFGVDTAKEQYCDPAEYYQGGHAQCYRQIQHHYYSDVHALRLA